MLNSKSLSAGLVVLSASITNAYAAGLDFISDTADALKDGIDDASIVIVALAIIFVAFGLLFGNMQKERAAMVMLGAVALGAALSIATFFVGLSG